MYVCKISNLNLSPILEFLACKKFKVVHTIPNSASVTSYRDKQETIHQVFSTDFGSRQDLKVKKTGGGMPFRYGLKWYGYMYVNEYFVTKLIFSFTFPARMVVRCAGGWMAWKGPPAVFETNPNILQIYIFLWKPKNLMS